jgi:hypothetical protein
MTRVRARGQDIRRYIIENIQKYPSDIAKQAASHFGITRQAVNKHLQRLSAEKAITQTGKTRSRSYQLCALAKWERVYLIAENLAEDVVWRDDIAPVLGDMPDNVKDIWQYGFTEMFNNAIDHSSGTSIFVQISKTAATTEMVIMDNGIGIFRKIQTALGLLDERHAVLELAKGKLTTDPQRHSGEGIFFSSRMFDAFQILSGGVFFSHNFGDEKDWIMEAGKGEGTFVRMRLHNHTARNLRRIFDQFTSGDDYGFNKTIVPVELAQYGDDKLVSRSQAKRLLARVELFKMVVFDFKAVATIGQAFADEIFRVFPLQHPNIELAWIHANSEVKRMIERAKSRGVAEEPQPEQPLLPGIEPLSDQTPPKAGEEG